MKRNKKLFQLIYTAVFSALIFVVTAYLPRFPTTAGYVHLGDGIIFIAASLLDAPYAIVAAALGASLSDLLSGYIIWAPATIIIKGLTALAFTSKKKNMLCFRNIIALGVSAVLCVGGYYLYEAVVIAKSFIVPLAEIPFNFMQSLVGAVMFLVVAAIFDKTPIIKKFFKFDDKVINIDDIDFLDKTDKK